jgi:membrane dipeptidase
MSEAAKLLGESLVVDACVTRFTFEFPKYVAAMKHGGVNLAAVTVSTHEDFVGAVKRVDFVERTVSQRPGEVIVRTVDEAREARRNGALAYCMYFQNSKMILNDLALVRALHKLGVRIMQLTYNEQNTLGAGCCELNGSGLTYFGREAVAEMNRVGIVVDLSHCNDATTMDAIETSKQPVTISHANSRLISPTPRNKSDEIIKALGKKDGVIGATIFGPCVKLDGRGKIEDILVNIDHVVKLTGVDHVGIGLDLARKFIDEGTVAEESVIKQWRPLRPDVFGSGPTDVYPPYPVGLEKHEDIPNLVDALLKRGYSAQDVKKILGENFLRVYRTVWGS